MVQDTAVRLAFDSIECETAEGIVHRLWELLAQKGAPPNGYAAKFSIPCAIAVALLRDDAGLGEYDETVVKGAELLRLAGKISYRTDPGNPYPNRFIGHIRVNLKNGIAHEHRQDYFRGGAGYPLSTDALRAKFLANCAFGGFSRKRAEEMADDIHTLFDTPKLNFSQFSI